MHQKIGVVLGTRPEIIKMAPVIKVLEARNEDYYVIHTGQHYSYSLDAVFFKQLELPEARYNLEAGSASHGQQTAKILAGIEKILIADRPDVVLVEGDTNSVLAGALAASKLHISVGHVEAGLRSYDSSMPEEINRVLADHCADYLFTPTRQSMDTLLGEGIPAEKVFITGNTIVDAVNQNLDLARHHSRVLAKLDLEPGGYFLATVHRQENTDDPERLTSIISGLRKVAAEFGLPLIYPAHPRAAKMISQFGLDTAELTIIEPVDFFDFLMLESNARLILTDSGGVQEEACILRVPCVTLRDNTERPETVEAGANMLAGTSAENILERAREMIDRPGNWQNPFGDGQAARRIIDIVSR